MFPMTITINNRAELEAVLTALEPLAVPDSAKKAHTDTTETKPVKSAPAKEQPKAEAPAVVEQTQTGGGKTYTLDDAKRLTTDVVKAGKRTEMVALLGKFGVQQAAKLPAEKVVEFCTEAEALLP